MKIEVEIKDLDFKVLSEDDVKEDDNDIVICVMRVRFGIIINDIKKAEYEELIKTTYLNELRGTEMDVARQKAIDDYINNLNNPQNEKFNETKN